MTVALFLFGAARASALVPGDTATISGSYSSYAATSSSDPDFAPCTALPAPAETFWAFLNGNERISDDIPGACSSTSSPDPSRPGVTDYALTYSYAANWGIAVNASDVGTTMTLTMSFHTMDNVVATETYQITPSTPSDTSTTATSTTTEATTTETTAPTSTAPVGTAPTTTASATIPGTPPASTSTLTVPPPPIPATTAAPTTTTASATTAVPAPQSKPKAAVITTATTVRAVMIGKSVTVTIRTNSKRKSLLCYRPTPNARTRCTAGYGTWTVRLRAVRHSTIKRLFVIKVASSVVAEKTITIRVA